MDEPSVSTKQLRYFELMDLLTNEQIRLYIFTTFTSTLGHTCPSLNMTFTNKPNLNKKIENQNKTKPFISERLKNAI